MEKIKLTYFNITRCGYYRFRDSALAFGGLSETLSDIKLWLNGKTLRQTKVFDPADGDSVFPVYISDLAIDAGTGDALLITWNETPTTAGGQVAAAAGDDPVGSVDVSLMDVPKGGIPGYPCFFLFIPSRSIVVTIRFDGQVHNGNPGLSRYIDDFLGKFSSHVVVVENDDGVRINGYVTVHGGEPQNVRPVYRSSQARVPGKLEWLIENRTQIRKLVRRDRLLAGVAPNYSRLQTIWNWFGITTPAVPHSGSVNFDFELDCSISEEQLDELVEFDALEHDGNKDIGFRMIGESGVIHWLSHALVKQEIDIDVKRTHAGLTSANDLLKVLSNHRASILSIVPVE